MSVCDLTMSCVDAKIPPWRSRRHQYPAREFALSAVVSQKGAGLRSAAPTFAISVFVQKWLVHAALCKLSSDRLSRWAKDHSPSSPSLRPTVLPSLPVCNGRTMSAVSKCYANEICLRNIKTVYLDCPAITLAVLRRRRLSLSLRDKAAC